MFSHTCGVCGRVEYTIDCTASTTRCPFCGSLAFGLRPRIRLNKEKK